MAGKVSVQRIDKGWQKILTLSRQIKQRKNHVKVGVLAGKNEERKEGQLTNPELALIHEFGSPAMGIPARSFVKSSFEAHKPEYLALMKKMFPAILKRKIDVNHMLGIVGAVMAADMKKGITMGAGIPPPLKPATIKRKGSTRPLLDTGQLVNSITWSVVEGGE